MLKLPSWYQQRHAFCLMSAILSTNACELAHAASTSASTPRDGAYTGHATHFEGLGAPYGGCGVPQSELETPNFVALNVQNTPRDYSNFMARPLQDWNKMGMWDNGRNCGRRIRVTLDRTCINGNISGEPGVEFCQGGSYVDDDASGATADFVVADSCQDGNGWCRDDLYHVDLASASLSRFAKDGYSIGDLRSMGPWANRLVRWEFVDAPEDAGDIRIGFRQNAKSDWAAAVFTNLPRGIHGVEVEVNGQWQRAGMIGDNGQVYVLPGASPYRLRVYDAYDQLLNKGRIYKLNFPCQGTCQAVYTAASYSYE